MVLLAIETSVPSASVALWMHGSVVYEKEFTSDRNHNSMIFEPLAEALQVLDGSKLTHVLVGTGPGSYSGTRTGIAAGQGVALTHGCPAVGIGSLAATPCSSPTSLAVGDARRGLYFISEITEAAEAREAELMDAVAFQTRVTKFCESADTTLFTFDDPTGAWLNEVQLPVEVVKTKPHARGLINVWSGLSSDRQDELVSQPLSPSYLRPPFTSKAKSGHPLLRQS